MAWNLRRLRTERGLSQERVAADSGIDRAYVSELERGLGNASIDLLDRLAALLQVSISEFFLEPTNIDEPPAPLRSGRRRRT
ncbi:helix-turn-helix domain-containing protein [Brevundimonas sp. UBA7534]|uniref:helix-turn-helix domain-containing protein n=1 Tax=Brevundimonas sp. UBA7534 TaxID=1946138 RepID=UPI0025BD84F3|nr:helix-turn-helix domain-containing protein [Brevundimonas sp. UBA7534]